MKSMGGEEGICWLGGGVEGISRLGSWGGGGGCTLGGSELLISDVADGISGIVLSLTWGGEAGAGGIWS